jgi:hypothetical protein
MPEVSCPHVSFLPPKVSVTGVLICPGCACLIRDPRHPANAGKTVFLARPEQAGDAVRRGVH